MPTLLLVRHARAGARGHGPADLDRPLDDAGTQQAAALPGLLLPLLTAAPADGHGDGMAASGPPDVASSPARRCVETVAPLAAAAGTRIVLDRGLLEGADARVLCDRLGALTRPTVWASHGDVIPELLAMLARRGLDLGATPRCQKGSTWVVNIVGGAATSARYLAPPR